jgi:hypothetical protein
MFRQSADAGDAEEFGELREEVFVSLMGVLKSSDMCHGLL